MATRLLAAAVLLVGAAGFAPRPAPRRDHPACLSMVDSSSSYAQRGHHVRVVESVLATTATSGRTLDLKGWVGVVSDGWTKCEVDPHCCCAEMSAVDDASIEVLFANGRGVDRYYFADIELAAASTSPPIWLSALLASRRYIGVGGIYSLEAADGASVGLNRVDDVGSALRSLQARPSGVRVRVLSATTPLDELVQAVSESVPLRNPVKNAPSVLAVVGDDAAARLADLGYAVALPAECASVADAAVYVGSGVPSEDSARAVHAALKPERTLFVLAEDGDDTGLAERFAGARWQAQPQLAGRGVWRCKKRGKGYWDPSRAAGARVCHAC